MHKGRAVFLFGAGSTLAWGSPLTSVLTKLIRESGFKTADNNTTITEFIFQKLLLSGYSEIDINFETIINVIEELIVFNSKFSSDKNLPSLLSSQFENIHRDEIFNFSIDGDLSTHGYQLCIPKGVKYNFSRFALNNQTPEQFFLLHLLNEIIRNISVKISKYSYHTRGYSTIDMDSQISKLFVEWMRILSFENNLRIYTLNYERIFKILLERSGIKVFEGFDCDEIIQFDSHTRANILKILDDTNCNSHYNLHGSIYWKVIPYDKDQLQNPEIILSSFPELSSNSDHALFQIERGKTLLVTNIITGYQKAQKSVMPPFKQMQSAFDRDCCFADKIYIIGYSFGDEHINQSLKTSIRHNQDIKLIIVDPHFIKNNMDYEFAINFFPYRQEGDMSPEKIGENLYSYFNGSFLVYTVSFEEFLESEVALLLEKLPQ